MKKRIHELMERARDVGWMMEPDARELLKLYNLPVTRFHWVHSREDALEAASEIGYPVVTKIVSPKIMHKSDAGGVRVGIRDEGELSQAYDDLSTLDGFDGIIVDQMARGIELIIGAKHDPQFGMVVLTGIGGTSVEIYQDIVIRMAPFSTDTAQNALKSLRGSALITGYRGDDAVNMEKLVHLMVHFSELAVDLEKNIESIDLNPVMCNKEEALIADARILLKEVQHT
jgi:acetate---CoA ligase (ADP-forming) subunit beta